MRIKLTLTRRAARWRQLFNQAEAGWQAVLPIHLRDSHWTLGEVVPRRLPRALARDNEHELVNGIFA